MQARGPMTESASQVERDSSEPGPAEVGVARRRSARGREGASLLGVAAVMMGALLVAQVWDVGPFGGDVRDGCTTRTPELAAAAKDQLKFTPARPAPGQEFSAVLPESGLGGLGLLMWQRPESGTPGEGCLGFSLYVQPDGQLGWQRLPESMYQVGGELVERGSIAGVVPPVAPPGDYDVCTDELAYCGVLTIEAPGQGD